MEKGEPTCIKSLSCSLVSTTSTAPRSMLRSTILSSFEGRMNVCKGGWPLSSMAKLMTLPPSIRQYGGVSVQPPAMSMRTGERPHTIWSSATQREGRLASASVFCVKPSRSKAKAFSLSPLNIASWMRVIKGASSDKGGGRGIPSFRNSEAASARSSW